MTVLSQEELDHYQRDGYLIRRQQIASTDLKRINEALDVAEIDLIEESQRFGRSYTLGDRPFMDLDHRTLQFEFECRATSSKPQLRVVEPISDYVPAIAELVRHPTLVAAVASILKCDALSLWTDKLNFKVGYGGGFDWHQDAPYWMHDADDVQNMPNVMVALDDAPLESGCLRGIRGSHLLGALPGKQDGSALAGFYTDPQCFDLASAVHFEMCAGDALFFDPFLIHGSDQNHTANRRRALIVTYQPAHRQTLKSKAVVNI
jgi:hypothetical protein